MQKTPRHDDTQATNPFSSSEIGRRLGQGGDSEKTNPFTSEELRSRLLNLERSEPAQSPVGAKGDIKSELSTRGARLLLESVQPAITTRLLEGNLAKFRLDFKAPLPGHHILAVAQQPDCIHIGVAVSDSDPDSAPKALAAIYFDPESDAVILQNVGPTKFAVSPGGSGMAPEHIVSASERHAIGPATWALRVLSGSSWTHVVQMTILSRSFFTLEGDEGASGGAGVARKRAIKEDSDQGRVATKRQRSGLAGTAVDIVIRPPEIRATPGLLVPIGNKTSTADSSLSGNPILNMKDGSTLTVNDAGEGMYTLTRTQQISQTSASVVFKATKSDVPGKSVAVKVFRIQLKGNTRDSPAHYSAIARACRAMEREIEIHKGLKHDRIVELYSVDSRMMALYLEYVEGSSLAASSWCNRPDWMFRGGVDDACRILTDVARGLAFLHSKGIVHNDLKPGNVLYSKDRGAIVCDLGLASDMKKTRNCGTPWYVAPENILGSHLRVGADDCWSLGIIGLYVLRLNALPDATFPLWQIAEMTVEGSDAALLADRWYGRVRSVRGRLSVPKGGTSTEHVRRDRLVQCVMRLTDESPHERPTADGILGMLLD